MPVEHVMVPREDPREGGESETAIADAVTAEVKSCTRVHDVLRGMREGIAAVAG